MQQSLSVCRELLECVLARSALSAMAMSDYGKAVSPCTPCKTCAPKSCACCTSLASCCACRSCAVSSYKNHDTCARGFNNCVHATIHTRKSVPAVVMNAIRSGRCLNSPSSLQLCAKLTSYGSLASPSLQLVGGVRCVENVLSTMVAQSNDGGPIQ